MLWILPLLFAIILWFRLGFWNRQPVRHYLTIYKKGLLADQPINNKLVVPQVFFYNVTDLSKELENELYDYVKEKQPSYHKKSHFMGYLKKGYFSIYRENTCIRGCITSRQVEFIFDKEVVDAYSTDFLYADTPYILKCLIQSHEYKKHIMYPTSIFSSTTKIQWVMPITTYDIQWVYTSSFKKYTFPLQTKFVKATPSSLNEIFSCFKTPFCCQMTPSVYTLSSLIESQNISIYSVYNPYLVAILFFKNSYELEEDLSIVDWIGTIIVDKNKELLQMISTILYGIHATFKIVRIHQLSHTPTYTTHYKTTQCRKYAYNYGIYSLPPSQCFFL